MSSARELVLLMKSIVAESHGIHQTTEIVPLVLLTLKPLTFQKSRELILDEADVVIPKGLYFSKSDIGKTFSFVMSHDGQKYYLLHLGGRG